MASGIFTRSQKCIIRLRASTAGRLPTSLKRALVTLFLITLSYAIASEAANLLLPHRVFVGVHYIEDVDFIPTYSSLAEEFQFLAVSGILQKSIIVSTVRVLEGFGLGSLIGISLGILSAWTRRLEYSLDPWMNFFRFTPALALLPLYSLWFGTGEISKILLIVTGVAVVTWLGTDHGIRETPQTLVRAALILGAGRWLLLRKILLPSALQHIFSSLRVALALAWVTLIVAELMNPRIPSLGYLLALASAFTKVQTILVGITVIGSLVLTSDIIAITLYNRATSWMRSR